MHNIATPADLKSNDATFNRLRVPTTESVSEDGSDFFPGSARYSFATGKPANAMRGTFSLNLMRPSTVAQSIRQSGVSRQSGVYLDNQSTVLREREESYDSGPYEKARFSTLLMSRRETVAGDERPRAVTLVQPSAQVATRRHSCGTFFQEARPVKDSRYFPPAAPGASSAVVICLYNEQGPELSRTIDSLADSGATLDVVVVADGLAKIAASQKLFLARMFGLTDMALLSDGPPWGTHDQIFISNPVERGASCSRFCVLLKRFNHKKINSHEWFFRAHAPNSGCRFALTTDTGAIFREGSVLKMIRFLETNDGVVAVTGRQRVMTEENQRVLGWDTPEKDDLFERCMRLLQGFDFEIDHTGGKAASCAAGLLPCLHGPCAFFRYGSIRGRCLDEYFDEWGYAPPHTLKLIGANLQLAEDRIPSLLGVLYSGGKCNNSAFDAVFEFEAELSLRAFITQRRRWINGTFAGLVYALTQCRYICGSRKHSIGFKIANVLLLSLQALGFVLTFLTPALFGFLMSSAVGLICIYVYPSITAQAQVITCTVYGAFYVLFVCALHDLPCPTLTFYCLLRALRVRSP